MGLYPNQKCLLRTENSWSSLHVKMKLSGKYLSLLVAVASAAAIIYGFTLQEVQAELSRKWIGFGTLGLFLVAMPLFLIFASRGKKMKDYMLNEENIHKMRESQEAREEEKHKN